MSDYRAIAGVSSTLGRLLRDRMENTVPVTIAPLDVSVSGVSGKRLNIYLYQVTENGYLKNQEIPGHGHPSAFGQPPLSLELHYLLTAHAKNETATDADLEAQQVLGDAMRVLHDLPIVTDALEITKPADGTVGDPILDPSLQNQFEKVKITLEPVTLEDLSKIWTALPQTNFRRSVAYRVSVVQIESQRPKRLPRPVGEPPSAGPRVYVVPYSHPQISEIRVRRPGDPPEMERPFPYIRIDDTLILKGCNFSEDATRVILNSVDATSQITIRQDDRIEVPIPDNAGLQPGPQPIKVVRDVMMGEPARPHLGFKSNLAVFVLVPRIDSVTPKLGTVPRKLQIQGKRLFHESLNGETLVGPTLIPKARYLPGAASHDISVPLPDTLPAWPVQCRLSGDLSIFPNLPDTPEVQVTIGGEGPHTATFSTKPATLAEAAILLETAIRNISGGGFSFQGTRITTVGDKQLVAGPGGFGDTMVFTGAVADQLKLTGGTGAATIQGYLSGELKPFPTLTANQPAVKITMNSGTHVITLSARPATLADAATKLKDAIQPSFAGTQVTTLENQLLILPGAAGDVHIEAVAGTDETSASELQLDSHYSIRVRVNSAESIDEVSLRLPWP